MSARVVLAIAMLAAACTRADDDDRDGPKALVKVETPAAAPTLDERDQYALLADIEGALGSGFERDGSAMARVRSAWTGKRVRWEVGFVPVFCRSHERCNVAPFDQARADVHARQGFMPELALDEGGWTALSAACAPHARCVLMFEGTLQRFAFSPDEPTALRFADVVVLGARAATPAESWVVTPSRPRS
jgi:hypothetical protein